MDFTSLVLRSTIDELDISSDSGQCPVYTVVGYRSTHFSLRATPAKMLHCPCNRCQKPLLITTEQLFELCIELNIGTFPFDDSYPQTVQLLSLA